MNRALARGTVGTPGPGTRRRTGRYIRKHWSYVIKQLALVIATATALYPLYWLVITSFKSQSAYLNDTFGLPWPINWGNVTAATHGGRFGLWFLNSAILTVGAMILGTAVAALAAFAFAKMRFGGSRTLLNVIVSLMVVPPVVMVVPLFILFTQIKLMSTYQGVILIYTGLIMPFSVYLLTNFFKTIPHEVIESSIIDGCTVVGILRRMVIPLSMPAIVTLIIVNALWVWNELLLALVFLPKDNMRTLMVGLTVFRSRLNLDIPVTMMGLLLATVPMVVLYIAFQRYFIHGLTAGALKE